MKYFGNKETGEVFSWKEANKEYTNKMKLIRKGILISLTDSRRGNDKAIMTKKHNETFIFKVVGKREWRTIPELEYSGWILKKDYDSTETLN